MTDDELSRIENDNLPPWGRCDRRVSLLIGEVRRLRAELARAREDGWRAGVEAAALYLRERAPYRGRAIESDRKASASAVRALTQPAAPETAPAVVVPAEMVLVSRTALRRWLDALDDASSSSSIVGDAYMDSDVIRAAGVACREMAELLAAPAATPADDGETAPGAHVRGSMRTAPVFGTCSLCGAPREAFKPCDTCGDGSGRRR